MKASKFRLIGKPRVVKSCFLLNKNFKGDNEIFLDINHDINIYDLKDKNKHAIVSMKLNIFKDYSDEKAPFSIDLEIEGVFAWDESIDGDKNELNILLYENAPAILYSYLRPLITSMTMEANLTPLVIPTMNFRKDK